MHQHDIEHIVDGVVGAAAVASTVLANPLLRRFYRKWGATDEEAARTLPGDELIASPQMQYTRAIDIEASPDEVWPWLVQIGYERAGWYSYDVLEDLVGAGDFVDGASSERIVPELQRLRVGDEIKLHESIGFQVNRIEAPHLLLLSDARDASSQTRFKPAQDAQPEDFMHATWGFHLLEAGRNRTRLLIRWRLDYSPSLANEIMWKGFVEPINFVMERRMMLGLKERVEAPEPGPEGHPLYSS